MPGGPPRSVALIGLRCSGKTSVGRRLAEMLELPFADLDLELAELAASEAGDVGRPAAPIAAGELLARSGVQRFRDLEERALERILASPAALVLATGGGTVERARNRERLRRACTCVWLRAEPAVLRQRLAADRTARPALTPAGAAAEIEELARRRDPFYDELATLRVDTGSADVEELAQRIARLLRSPA